MKFIKLPVSEANITLDKIKQHIKNKKKDDGYDNGIKYDWEAMGIRPESEEDDFEEEIIELEDNDFRETVRRVRVDLIEDYEDVEQVRNGKKCSMMQYNGIYCTVIMTAAEIDELLTTNGIEVI